MTSRRATCIKLHIMKPTKKISKQDAMRIAIEAMVDPRTVEKIYAGEDARPRGVERVRVAAKKLRLAAPPK